jgi:plastocyanin
MRLLLAPFALAALTAGCAFFTPPDTPPRDAASDSLIFHSCTADRFVDLRAAMANRTVTFGSGPQPFSFTPPCVRVTVGQAVAFTGAFNVHPLAPGVYANPSASPADNPIRATSAGDRAEFTFPTAGTFPFFCTVHGAGGMAGVVRVEAAP